MILSDDVARLVISDLYKLDYLKEQAKSDSLKFVIFARQFALKDSIISKQAKQVSVLQDINSEYIAKEGLYKSETQLLKKKIRKAKGERNLVGIAGLALLILAIL